MIQDREPNKETKDAMQDANSINVFIMENLERLFAEIDNQTTQTPLSTE